MKFFPLILILCLVALAQSEVPVQVSGNNVGDIVTVGVNANAVLSNNMEANILTVLAAILNQQAVLNGGDNPIVPTANDEAK